MLKIENMLYLFNSSCVKIWASYPLFLFFSSMLSPNWHLCSKDGVFLLLLLLKPEATPSVGVDLVAAFLTSLSMPDPIAILD